MSNRVAACSQRVAAAVVRAALIHPRAVLAIACVHIAQSHTEQNEQHQTRNTHTYVAVGAFSLPAVVCARLVVALHAREARARVRTLCTTQ